METESKKLIINPNIKNIYGFLILDIDKLLIGTVSKDKKEINLKKNIFFDRWKIRRGGASTTRFYRIYRDRIAKTVKLIDDNLEKIFIMENKLEISGIILAGTSKTIERYLSSKYRNKDLNEYITTIIEIDYGGELGFNQAIQLSMLNI